MQNMFSTAGK